MKSCMKCGERKEMSAFYAHKRMKDGRLNKCKTCTKRDVRENRRKKIDYYREYDRNRAGDSNRIEARNRYAGSDAGKVAGARAKLRYIESNPNKRKATNAVNNAIRDGRLHRRPCENCGTKKTQAHHDDYSKPLDVRWLCSKCHSLHHKQEREARREAALSP